jgi:hypothetical protein
MQLFDQPGDSLRGGDRELAGAAEGVDVLLLRAQKFTATRVVSFTLTVTETVLLG